MRRKTDATDGTKYVYEFTDGTQVKVEAGKDEVTEELICYLKRQDNREYEKNLDAAGRKMTKEEKEQWMESHPGEKPKRVWNASLDFVNVDGANSAEEYLSHQMVSNPKTDPDIDRLYELLDWMPEKRKAVMSLYFAGFSQTEIAKQLGISTSTVNGHFREAKTFIRKNFHEPENS